MLAGLCLLSGLGLLVFTGRIIWVLGWKKGHRDAWQDITDEFRRYD